MSDNAHPVFIRLTSIYGEPVTLTPIFKIVAMSDTDDTANNPNRAHNFFHLYLDERSQLKNYIKSKAKEKGLNPRKVYFPYDIDRSGPSLLNARYKARNVPEEEGSLLETFDIAHTYIITPMHTEEVYRDGGSSRLTTDFTGTHMNRGSGVRKTRLRAVTMQVIQTEEEIREALRNGVDDLHDPESYKEYRKRGMEYAKSIVDANIEKIASKPKRFSWF